jgi:uncharacterized protein YjdB
MLAAGEVCAQPSPSLDEYLCLRGATTRHVERTLGFAPQSGLAVRDRLIAAASAEPTKIDLRKPLGLCLPAGAPAAPLVDAATHLEVYAARLSRTRPPQPRLVSEPQRVTNRFGSDELRLKSMEEVLVPSAAMFDPPPAPSSVPGTIDDFTCYAAEPAAGLRGQPVATSPLTLASGIGTLQYDLRAPVRLCFPADLGGDDPSAPAHPNALACYRAKLARTRPPQSNPFPRFVATANRFGSERLTLTTTIEFCVPSLVQSVNATPTPQRTAVPTPTPTLTPPPGFNLRVAPASATVDMGESAHFTATAVFLNGDMEDFTERVLWKSSTGAALAPNEPGDRGRIDAADGGSTVISVLDEATGVTSTATGGDAILGVNWTLERIELLPTTATRGKGESIRLRATGHFAGGVTRAIADRLVYASNAPGVVSPTNDSDSADHSRAVALAEGSAVLSATDPLSGITSTASGDDVTMTVVGPLERCAVLQGSIGFGVGSFYQFTAHGFYPGGFERVVTQQVAWGSDDPTTVSAPNGDGDRSRVIAIAPGEAHITATDTVTGLVCEGRPTVTVATPTALLLQPPDPLAWRPMRAGRSWHAIAIERFTPSFEKKYVTERVVFASSDPSIVTAPNVAGDRGRLDAVGSGTASIVATDPVSGLVSQPIYLRALDGLTRVEVPSAQFTLFDVGATFFTYATGEFADGLASLSGEDVTFTSDNPAVAEVAAQGPSWLVHALAPGQATISATDNLTGISSDAFGASMRLGVRGPIERIVLIPPLVTRRVGEAHPFAALVYYAGGASELATQQLVYSSSAPDVAVATNDYYVRGRVDAVAGGTAMITATDPVSGVSSTDSGGSARLTVVGPLSRVRVQPSYVTRSYGRAFSFTAIGTDAGGREVNVTQDVIWSSSDPVVAVAPNTEGNRSRIQSHAIGTTTISAFDPQDDVSSAGSNDDATFVVDGFLSAIVLSTEKTQLAVGEVIQLTATGYLSRRNETINLTQEVEYSSNNPSILEAQNTPGDRSRILALKPGVAVISARDPATGVVTNTNGKVTLVVTGP